MKHRHRSSYFHRCFVLSQYVILRRVRQFQYLVSLITNACTTDLTGNALSVNVQVNLKYLLTQYTDYNAMQELKETVSRIQPARRNCNSQSRTNKQDQLLLLFQNFDCGVFLPFFQQIINLASLQNCTMPRKKLIRRNVTQEVLYLWLHKTRSPNVLFENSIFRFVPGVLFLCCQQRIATKQEYEDCHSTNLLVGVEFPGDLGVLVLIPTWKQTEDRIWVCLGNKKVAYQPYKRVLKMSKSQWCFLIIYILFQLLNELFHLCHLNSQEFQLSGKYYISE